MCLVRLCINLALQPVLPYTPHHRTTLLWLWAWDSYILNECHTTGILSKRGTTVIFHILPFSLLAFITSVWKKHWKDYWNGNISETLKQATFLATTQVHFSEIEHLSKQFYYRTIDSDFGYTIHILFLSWGIIFRKCPYTSGMSNWLSKSSLK